MTVRNLEALLAPRSVVLVGASGREGTVGNIIARNLLSGRFKGPVSLVNPKQPVIAGTTAIASLTELAAPADLAIIATPPDTVAGVVAQVAAMGTRAAVVITAGLAPAERQRMLDAARPHLLRVQGPNCIGLMLPHVGLNASFCHIDPLAGGLAFLSQSGALITGVVDWASGRGIGFSHVVSLGDMADVDFGDLLDYLAGDARSKAILLYVESITSAQKFMSAARRAARAKPVIVVKAGRHAEGARAALSHTGALAGSDAAYDAAFRRAGLVRVGGLQDLFEAAEMLARLPKLRGERLVVLTNGGGAGVLAADRIADHGGHLAQLAPATIAALDRVLPANWSHANPVDIIGDAPPERYRAALDVLIADPASDAVLVLNCPTALASSTAVASEVIAAAAARKAATGAAPAIVAGWLGGPSADEARKQFAAASIPIFETPAMAVDGFMHVVEHGRAQAALMQTPASAPGVLSMDRARVDRIVAAVLADGRCVLTEIEAKLVLTAYGIATVETRIAATPSEVRAEAARLLEEHDEVVIKILSRDITHKSDVGGVRLGLASAVDAEFAAREMMARASVERPEARLDGCTVQPMVRRKHAHELLAGVSVDATFGPLVTFGAGGVAVEVTADTALALVPLDMRLARDAMSRTRVWRLLQGYRDRPAANIDAIAGVLVRLGYLVAQHPEIREIDINPLLGDADGVIALDARVTVVDPAREPRTPMAIRPYPSAWEKQLSVGSLGDVLLRPVRPEDEALYHAFFARIAPDDMRLRFFMARPDLGHAFLARLTQIDYAREMAFVALGRDSGELLGVARLVADPDYSKAEYAVLVRSDLKGRGLGWQLMQHLIEYARAEGLRELYGSVLRDNATMLSMATGLGFTITPNADDRQLDQVVLDLSARGPVR